MSDLLDDVQTELQRRLAMFKCAKCEMVSQCSTTKGVEDAGWVLGNWKQLLKPDTVGWYCPTCWDWLQKKERVTVSEEKSAGYLYGFPIHFVDKLPDKAEEYSNSCFHTGVIASSEVKQIREEAKEEYKAFQAEEEYRGAFTYNGPVRERTWLATKFLLFYGPDCAMDEAIETADKFLKKLNEKK